MAYTAKREDLLASASELFGVVENGAVKIEVNQTYPLREVAQAHRDLEGAQDHRLDGADPLSRAGLIPPRGPLFRAARGFRNPAPRTPPAAKKILPNFQLSFLC